ncbi:MAG: hypothetical protein LAO21_09615 [Acidobacteriia bacterium]|nr:hypothetical protein [Terriglobia bacterium]
MGSNLSWTELIRSPLERQPDHWGRQDVKRAIPLLSEQVWMGLRRPHVVNSQDTEPPVLASKLFMTKRGQKRRAPAKAKVYRTCSYRAAPKETQKGQQAGYSGLNQLLKSGWKIEVGMR